MNGAANWAAELNKVFPIETFSHDLSLYSNTYLILYIHVGYK